jgi:hypothetical protein
MKDNIGIIYAVCMLPLASDTIPMNNGPIAPPRIAITKKEDATFVSSPSPFIPNAKIVGFIIDMKNGVATNAYNAVSPDVLNAIINNTILIIE